MVASLLCALAVIAAAVALAVRASRSRWCCSTQRTDEQAPNEDKARARCLAATTSAASRLDLSLLRLKELPSELLAASFTSSLGELSLRCNALAASTLTSLCALRSLQSLDLAANQLSALPLDALPRTLTHLDVSANALTALSLTALVASLPRLTTVSLAYNRLTSLDSLPPPTNIASSKTLGFASALPLLTHIDVSSNRLTSLAAVLSSSCVFNYVQELAPLPSLLVLQAPGNALSSLTLDTVRYWSALQRLELQGNRLSILAPLSSLTALHTLSLTNNALTALPSLPSTLLSLRAADNRFGDGGASALASLNSLSALTHLDLARNFVHAAQVDLRGCGALTYLDLSHNALSALPPGVATLTALHTLSLPHNSLTSLRELDLAALPTVRLVDVRYNRTLDTLPFSFVTHPAVRSDFPNLILPRLYLGPLPAAQNAACLRHLQVTHVLQLLADPPPRFPDFITYKVAPMEDSDRQELHPLVLELSAWLSATLTASPNHVVLVHCQFGNSRSAAVVVAHVMRTQALDFNSALAFVKQCRPSVNPNQSFRAQLLRMQDDLRRDALMTW